MWFRRETSSIFYVESDYESTKLSGDKVNIFGSFSMRVEAIDDILRRLIGCLRYLFDIANDGDISLTVSLRSL